VLYRGRGIVRLFCVDVLFYGGRSESRAGSIALRIRVGCSVLFTTVVSLSPCREAAMRLLTGSESQSYSARWLCNEARAAAAVAAGRSDGRRIPSGVWRSFAPKSLVSKKALCSLGP
jgi:hypothetical protein